MARVIVPFTLLLFLVTLPVANALTPVEDDNNPVDEEDLYEVINTMMGTSFTSSAQLGTYEIESDEWWFELNGEIAITATYAGQDQDLWWENSTSSGHILTRSTDGYDYSTAVFNTTGGDFYFKDITDGYTWYSRDDLNADGETHMVTFDMRIYEYQTFICAFEDISGLGDQDYNDLVFKITLAAPTSICADDDGDGYGVCPGCDIVNGCTYDGNDCDDGNPSVHPGATEACDGVDNDCDAGTPDGSGEPWYGDPCDGPDSDLCEEGTYSCAGDQQVCSDNTGNDVEGPPADPTCSDGVDNDCDGTTDGSDTDCIPTCIDNDGDGYGNPGDPSCPNGPQTDCDDNNGAVNPGKDEVCNGIDDDCDDLIDDDDPSCTGQPTWYQDNDDDGYGNPAETLQACTQPQGYVTDNTDCDDNNPDIHPGAIEVIDGVDNNCNGLVDEGICSSDCTVCDMNNDGVCDEEDLIIFGASHGWDDWDCDLNADIECICDLIAPNRTCDDLDGICFTNAYESPECRAPIYIEKLRPRSCEPGNAIRIIGSGFGDGIEGDGTPVESRSVVHVGPKKFEFGSSRIKLWTDTRIRLKIAKKKYTKNSCAWFNGDDFRKVKVWVTVGDLDSNKNSLKILKPATCP
jgi:hypothetical protein